MATNGDASAQLTVAAAYQSSVNPPFTTSQQIGPAPSASVEDKTNYLQKLRQAVLATQEQVNQHLTSRMEDDRARAATNSEQPTGSVDEAKEEENYGEEVVESED